MGPPCGYLQQCTPLVQQMSPRPGKTSLCNEENINISLFSVVFFISVKGIIATCVYFSLYFQKLLKAFVQQASRVKRISSLKQRVITHIADDVVLYLLLANERAGLFPPKYFVEKYCILID